MRSNKSSETNRVASIKKIVLDHFEPFQNELTLCSSELKEISDVVAKRWDVEIINLENNVIGYRLPQKYQAVGVWGSKDEVEKYVASGYVLSANELLVHINMMESWQSISEKLKKIYESKSMGTFVLKEKEISLKDIAIVFSDYYSFPDMDLGEILKNRVKTNTRPSQLKKEFLNKIFELEMLIDPYLKVLIRGKRQLVKIEDSLKDLKKTNNPPKPRENIIFKGRGKF